MHPILLLTQEAEDLRRDAGLRGEALTNAVIGMTAVFVLGIAVVAFVAWRGRRARQRGGPP